MTAWLARNGFPGVSKHTVDRLMRQEGMRGLVRGRKTRTTIRGKDGRRARDLLNRQFRTTAPNRAWVTDFTYCSTWSGFTYVAFAIDLYSRAIVGWSASTTKDVAFVESCLAMAMWRRDHAGRPVPKGMIHHSDAGSQYTSIRFTETLTLQGLSASIGSIGDAYDNAVAETTIGLYKTRAAGTRARRTQTLQVAARLPLGLYRAFLYFRDDANREAPHTSGLVTSWRPPRAGPPGRPQSHRRIPFRGPARPHISAGTQPDDVDRPRPRFGARATHEGTVRVGLRHVLSRRC